MKGGKKVIYEEVKVKGKVGFGRRFLIFMLGFLFGIIVLVGSVVGVGFWAYKSINLNTLEGWGVNLDGVLESDSPIKDLTIENWVQEIGGIFSGAADSSIRALQEKFKLSIVTKLEEILPEAALSIPITQLTTKEGIDRILQETPASYMLQFVGGDNAPGLLKTLFSGENKTLSTVTSGNIEALFVGVRVGEVMNYVKGEPTEGETRVPWYKDPEKTQPIRGLEYYVANVQLEEFLGGSFEFATAFDGMYVGEAMNYTKDGLTDEQPTDPAAPAKYRWKDADGNAVSGMTAIMANVSMGDLLGGTFNADGLKDDIKLGDIIDFGDSPSSIFKALGADTTVAGLNDRVKSIRMGELMGLSRKEIGKDQAGNTVFETDGAGKTVWYKDDGTYAEKASGIMNAFADVTTDGMTDDATIRACIDGIAVGDIVPITETSSRLMVLLKDTKVGNLSAQIDSMKFGDIMSMYRRKIGVDGEGNPVYEKDADGYDIWYKDSAYTERSSGISAAFADFSINNMNGEAFETKIKNLCVADIFTVQEGDVLSLLPNPESTKISTLPAELTAAVRDATMGRLNELGILGADMAETFKKLSSFVYSGQSDAADHWQAVSLSQFFKDLADKVSSIPGI